MSGGNKFSVLRQNIVATNAQMQNERRMVMHKNMCWRCQKGKPLKGGKLKFFGEGAPRMFVCADCLAEKAAAKEQA
jgi:hypothetical protein